MLDAEVPSEQAQDPQGVNSPHYNRHPERTPMQWDASPNAGFRAKTVEPWLRIPEHEKVNVQAQQDDPHSMLTLFRRLIELRRQLPALTSGSYHRLDTGDENVLAYLRDHEGQRVIVVLNFGSGPATLDLSRTGAAGETLCSTHLDRDGRLDLKRIHLRPDEGMLVKPGPSAHPTP